MPYKLHQSFADGVAQLGKLDNLYLESDIPLYSDDSLTIVLPNPVALELNVLADIRVTSRPTLTINDINGNEYYSGSPLIIETLSPASAKIIEWRDINSKPNFTGWATKAFTDGSTSDIAEGSNKYYTDLRVKTYGDTVYPQLSVQYTNPTWLSGIDASIIKSGTIDLARIPALPSANTIVCTTIPAMSAPDQALVGKGTVVIESRTGNTYRYSGSGSVVLNASYIQQSDLTPDWATITNRPTNVSYWSNDAGYLTALSSLDPSKIAQTASYLFVTDTEKTTWNAKQAGSSVLTSIATLSTGTGLVKLTNGIASLDTSTYATTTQLGAYLPIANPAFTGTLTGPTATFTGYVKTGSVFVADQVQAGDLAGQGARIGLLDSVAGTNVGWLIQKGSTNDKLQFLHQSSGGWAEYASLTRTGDLAIDGKGKFGAEAAIETYAGTGWSWTGHTGYNSTTWSGFMQSGSGQIIVGSPAGQTVGLYVGQDAKLVADNNGVTTTKSFGVQGNVLRYFTTDGTNNSTTYAGIYPGGVTWGQNTFAFLTQTNNTETYLNATLAINLQITTGTTRNSVIQLYNNNAGYTGDTVKVPYMTISPSYADNVNYGAIYGSSVTPNNSNYILQYHKNGSNTGLNSTSRVYLAVGGMSYLTGTFESPGVNTLTADAYIVANQGLKLSGILRKDVFSKTSATTTAAGATLLSDGFNALSLGSSAPCYALPTPTDGRVIHAVIINGYQVGGRIYGGTNGTTNIYNRSGDAVTSIATAGGYTFIAYNSTWYIV